MVHLQKVGYAYCVAVLFCLNTTFATTVTQISATYQNGQVFLTWKNVATANQKYKVYRFPQKIGSIYKLSASTYLGYVMDNSGKNVRKSQLKNETDYFKINDTALPLTSGTGLYVVTCTDNLRWYYAVTVEDVVTGQEDQTMILGSNSISFPVQEHRAIPKPVVQNTITLGTHTSYEYVIWGNNQNAPTMPAFNNAGSLGYNFTFIQHSLTEKSLYVLFRDDDPFSDLTPDNCDNCNVLILDDWLPNGQSTYWFGYNENYDIYSPLDTVFTSGTVRSYTQAQIKFILYWVTNNLGVDPSLVYASGSSHNGFGALLTANLIPDVIAAEWLTVPPPVIKAPVGSDWEKMWCGSKYNLPTDITNPVTGLPMNIWDVLDMRTMYELNTQNGIPFIGAVNGKQDQMIGWVQSVHWYDSLEYSQEGGVWYWDQRQHNGTGKQFQDGDINFNLKRYSTTKSYPAFSYCSINQDPGTGTVSSGDDYGAINGYLDWDDSIQDEPCDYSINCFVKDMYVNSGELMQQYDSCFADITFRRLQQFRPAIGTGIKWTVRNSTNHIVAGGMVICDGYPITLYNIPIYRSGSTISLHTNVCLRTEDSTTDYEPKVQLFKNANGYLVNATILQDADVQIRLIDLAGRILDQRNLHWQKGENEFEVEPMNRGEYILQIISPDLMYDTKLFF